MENHGVMLKKPLISIIIPTYNRAHIISDTLNSIIAQSFTNWECIVVDDGSTDNTSEVLSSYIKKDNRFRYYKRPENKQKGPCSCRNYGFEISKGDYINFFDSDDLLKPEAYEKALGCFHEITDAVIMSSALTDFKTGKQININKTKSLNLLTDYFVGEVTFLVCGPLWKREFLEQQAYLFDENIGNIDDWDFNLRMLYVKPELAFLEDILIYYRMHPNSFSKEPRKLNKIEIASDFVARDKHLKLIKHCENIDSKRIENFILYRNKRFFKWAISQKTDVEILRMIFKELVSKQLSFHRYIGVVKSCVGYCLVRLTGKGYVFFKG